MKAKKSSQMTGLESFWGRFIDWEKRRKGENDFLVKTLKKHGTKSVFDACMGDGCDSIYLLKEGFDVSSNELDLGFIRKAQANARENNVKLSVSSFDWRKLGRHFNEESFDAVICLGNSITLLFSKNDRLKTLQNFHKILKKGGVLVIDQRNYDYILKKRKEILAGNFRYSKKFVYCGESVESYPIKISSKEVLMEYLDTFTGKKTYLRMYPFKKNELKNEIKKAGFSGIETFYDYKKRENKKCDFVEFVAKK